MLQIENACSEMMFSAKMGVEGELSVPKQSKTRSLIRRKERQREKKMSENEPTTIPKVREKKSDFLCMRNPNAKSVKRVDAGYLI